MPNKPRPRCPTCEAAMKPLYRKGPTGKAFVQVPNAFHCSRDDLIARGRHKPAYLPG